MTLTGDDVVRYGAVSGVARAYVKGLFEVPVIATLYAISAHIGISPNTIRKVIRDMKREGLIESSFVYVHDADGTCRRLTAYYRTGLAVQREVYV